MMTLDEVDKALDRIVLPAFVESVTASKGTWHPAQREYRLHVTLAHREIDTYHPERKMSPQSNHPFDLPADEDALRAQVTAAVIMGCAHEVIEQASDGGQHFCNPHGYAGGSEPDWNQWIGLLDNFHGVVRDYATAMPVQ